MTEREIPRFQEDLQMVRENMVQWSSKGGKCSCKSLAAGPLRALDVLLMCQITLLEGVEITFLKSLIMELFSE